MSLQGPAAVVLIRPSHFSPNPCTSVDNAFQSVDHTRDVATISRDAYAEVSLLADRLHEAGIVVHLFESDEVSGPDSVFPNNWFSTHAGGQVAIYPMHSPSRRQERRSDIIEMLKQRYRVQDVTDYSGLEHDGMFLEGTGAMVLDHRERVAYAARSHRANPLALERFCSRFNYESMVFDATDRAGRQIYHTNVMMCIASQFALIGLELMDDVCRREDLVESLEGSGREIIALTHEQILDFAGNAIELQGPQGRLLVISRRALRSLKDEQVAVIERSCTILAVDVPTIELAGGSVRCMIAGIHLTARPARRIGEVALAATGTETA
ncbi:MAG: amidinotransferase [Actinobacteria bacterium]|nr:amidinotransferase [Actinomycetota bacterium]